MAIPFSRTTRALAADRGIGGTLAIGLALTMLALWGGWFVFGRVTLYEVSRAAHVEVISSSHDIATLNGGRLIASNLFVGRKVHAGELLAELDSDQDRLRLADAEARLATYPARLAALRNQLGSARAAQGSAAQAGHAALSAARARTREAQTSAEFGHRLAGRQQADIAAGAGAPVEADRAEADARRADAARDALAHEEARVGSDATARGAERDGDTLRLLASLDATRSEQVAARLLLAQLKLELDARQIRAPVDGVIGDVAPLPLGKMLGAGARLATIVPDGALRVVAAFDPASALGRLASGQSARLRLDGFSWTQFGDFAASVDHVAAEPGGDGLRVELLMRRDGRANTPLRHGMTGQVEVAIDRVSPIVLLLRTIGELTA